MLKITLFYKKRFEKRKKEPNKDRKKKHFFVPIEEIKENDYDLSINKYKDEVYEEVKYEKPEKIMGKIEKLETDILGGIEKLKGTGS